jgi:serpin B
MNPFQKRNTREEDFMVSAQEKVRVPLMYQQTETGCADEETFRVLDLPYACRERPSWVGAGRGGMRRRVLSMVVLLPKKVDGLPELEKSITVDKLASLLSHLPLREINIYLPKFKLETSFGLSPTLEAMGMKRAFSREADFSGISSEDKLYISAVLHKAYVDVNEEGTEAAAATGAVMRSMAARLPHPVPVFRADHPFLFLIRDTRTGSILFMGRLTSPTK